MLAHKFYSGKSGRDCIDFRAIALLAILGLSGVSPGKGRAAVEQARWKGCESSTGASGCGPSETLLPVAPRRAWVYTWAVMIV